MSIDPSIKKNVINLINKERDIKIYGLSYKPDITNQEIINESKEISAMIKGEIVAGVKKKQSVFCVLVKY